MITLEDLAIWSLASMGILAIVVLSGVMTHRYVMHTQSLKQQARNPQDPILDDTAEKKL